MSEKTYEGACFCGAVQIAVTGDAEAMGYCHCESCRAWAAAPVNAFTLWKPDQVKVTKGQDSLALYQKTERSQRQFCRTCGGHIMTYHPPFELTDVYAAILPDLQYKPEVHIFYGERALSIPDGLPKFKDLPSEMGGSGETLPE